MNVEEIMPAAPPPPPLGVRIELTPAETTGLKAFLAKYHDCNRHPTACALVKRLPGEFIGTPEHV